MPGVIPSSLIWRPYYTQRPHQAAPINYDPQPVAGVNPGQLKSDMKYARAPYDDTDARYDTDLA